MQSALALHLYLKENGLDPADIMRRGDVLITAENDQLVIKHWGLKIKEPTPDELEAMAARVDQWQASVLENQSYWQQFIGSVKGKPYDSLSKAVKEELLVYALVKLGIIDSEGKING